MVYLIKNIYRANFQSYIKRQLLKPVFYTTVFESSFPKKIKDGQFYLHGIAPREIGRYDPVCLLHKLIKGNDEDVKTKYIPADLPFGFKIKQIIDREKEGGAIIKYSYISEEQNQINEEETILDIVQEHLDRINNVKTFGFLNAKLYPIKGVPFNEDLFLEYPTRFLKVDMLGSDIQMEKLYDAFREFGRLTSITYHPPEASGFPRYAVITYFNSYNSSAARVCLHGMVFDGTKIFIHYKSKGYYKIIWDWLRTHPRITIPILLGAFIGILYSIFDPLRVFSITNKVSGRFNMTKNENLKWIRLDYLKSTFIDHFLKSAEKENLPIWTDTNEKLAILSNNLQKLPASITLVHGPKGSGKSELVKHAIKGRNNVLEIHCSEFVKSNKQENLTIVAKEFGYFPVFNFLNRLIEMVDIGMTATIGKPANLVSTQDNKADEILTCATRALSRLSKSALKNNESQPSDEIKPIPVLIFYDFLKKSTSDHPLWNKLIQWSNDLVNNNIAEVIFVSENPSAHRILSNMVNLTNFHTLGLSDASLEDAMDIVYDKLNSYTPQEIRSSIRPLGGRLSDLSNFILKVRSGQTPNQAISDIIHSAKIDIGKRLFGSLSGTGDSVIKPLTSWLLVKEIEKKGYVGYDQIKVHPYFEGGDEVLQALEKEEIIIIEHKDGKPYLITPGRPIYLQVFHQLAKDNQLEALLLFQHHTEQLKLNNGKIQQIENEISILNNLKTEVIRGWTSYLNPINWFSSKIYWESPKPIKDRVAYLLAKLKGLNEKVKSSERLVLEAKKTLQKEPEFEKNNYH